MHADQLRREASRAAPGQTVAGREAEPRAWHSGHRKDQQTRARAAAGGRRARGLDSVKGPPPRLSQAPADAEKGGARNRDREGAVGRAGPARMVPRAGNPEG